MGWTAGLGLADWAHTLRPGNGTPAAARVEGVHGDGCSFTGVLGKGAGRGVPHRAVAIIRAGQRPCDRNCNVKMSISAVSNCRWPSLLEALYGNLASQVRGRRGRRGARSGLCQWSFNRVHVR